MLQRFQPKRRFEITWKTPRCAALNQPSIIALRISIEIAPCYVSNHVWRQTNSCFNEKQQKIKMLKHQNKIKDFLSPINHQLMLQKLHKNMPTLLNKQMFLEFVLINFNTLYNAHLFAHIYSLSISVAVNLTQRVRVVW